MSTAEAALLLVVDDDLGTCLLEQRELMRRGYRVVSHTSAVAALAAPECAVADCWLVDQTLDGGETGLDLIAELRRRGLHAPVVLVTVSDDPNVLLLALRAGVRDFVRKGDGFLELLVSRIEAVLASVLAERQLQMSKVRAETEAVRRRELEVEIGERRAAEARAQSALARLQEMDRRKDEFLAMLGHELRNPLAPIASAVEVLQLAPGEIGRVTWAAGVIGRQIHQLRRLVDDLLDVARIMNGRMALRFGWVDLRDVIAQAIERVQPLIEQRQHSVIYAGPAAPIVVEGDLVRLVQVVANLLDNSAKYTSPGGTIEVRLSVGADGWEIQIEDNGRGIPAENLESLFDLFVQGERTADRAEGGLGLGLALVRRIVAMHGGSVQATSDGLGLGSVFYVRLPMANDGNRPVEEAAPDKSGNAMELAMRVLVVDDNEDAAVSTAILLGLWGCTTWIAKDGVDALALIQSEDPDVVLLDIGLPRLDGYGVLREAQQLPGARVRRWIALSGYGQESDRRRSLMAGFERHLVKPVDPVVLRAALSAERPGTQKPPSSQ
jgi:signal transduction histidine kinase